MSFCKVKCCSFDEPVAPAECLAACSDRMGKCNFTPELLRAMFDTVQDRGTRISTTTLTSKCPRAEWFKRLTGYAEDPKQLWSAFRGTMFHGRLEQYNSAGTVAEHRYHVDLPGLGPLSGSPDLVDIMQGVLYDYKFVKEVPRFDYAWPDHVMQVKVNRWIVDNAHTVTFSNGDREQSWDLAVPQFRQMFVPEQWNELVLVYMDDKGPKPITVTKSATVTGKTTGRPKSIRVSDLGDDGQIEAFIRERYELMADLFNMDEPPAIPSGFERWSHPLCNFCPVRDKCVDNVIGEAL